MEAISPVRSGLLGFLLLVAKLSVLLVQNRVHLYNFLLLKIILFNHWLSGLTWEAQGPCGRQAHPHPGLSACAVVRALRAGLTLIEVPLWLLLQGPRLVWAAVLGCARALSLAPQRPGVSGWRGLSEATWTDLLLSCLHSLMLAALLLLLLAWRLCRKAHRCGQGWPPCKVLLENRVVLELLELLKRLYWWVQSATVLTSWHLAYVVTWATCLASHLLQTAFEHTAQLAQDQEAEPQDASGPLSPLPEPLAPEAQPAQTQHGALGE
ncbi:PREDICTED: Williams-Beuren syndrome chromosomal region 28 protein [Condylura cristata]|uniref:Williams-Beuren syndrome chromosomal region 28 protein n=1 Tax=Condylura cristata TaxID=143302 RepID=UPI0003343D44|nr:PREDICTED: Williams-Beuren syndrome chromosomal region 28 protein [Condylura cristata]